eukprot:5182450-Prymnesium_polylepis.1
MVRSIALLAQQHQAGVVSAATFEARVGIARLRRFLNDLVHVSHVDGEGLGVARVGVLLDKRPERLLGSLTATRVLLLDVDQLRLGVVHQLAKGRVLLLDLAQHHGVNILLPVDRHHQADHENARVGAEYVQQRPAVAHEARCGLLQLERQLE